MSLSSLALNLTYLSPDHTSQMIRRIKVFTFPASQIPGLTTHVTGIRHTPSHTTVSSGTEVWDQLLGPITQPEKENSDQPAFPRRPCRGKSERRAFAKSQAFETHTCKVLAVTTGSAGIPAEFGLGPAPAAYQKHLTSFFFF